MSDRFIPPHNHSVDDLPVGKGPGKVALWVDVASLISAPSLDNAYQNGSVITTTPGSGDVVIGGDQDFILSTSGAVNQTGSGQVTFSGNVDADAGLDVVGGSFTHAAGGTGDVDVAWDFSGGVTISGDNLTVNDGVPVVFGDDSNWSVQYDEAGSDALEVAGAAQTADNTAGYGLSVTGSQGGSTPDGTAAGDGGPLSFTSGAGGAGSATGAGGDSGDVLLDVGAAGADGGGGAGSTGTVKIGGTTVNPIEATTAADELTAIALLTNTTESAGFFVGSSDPSGTVTGAAASLFLRDTGAGGEVYVNTSAGSGTTWTQLGSGGGGIGGSVGTIDNAIPRADGAGGSTLQGGASNDNVILEDNGHLRPEVDSGGRLGTATFGWQELHLSSGGDIIFNNDITIRDAFGPLFFEDATAYRFDSDVTPRTDGGGSLGSAGVPWGSVYINEGDDINWIVSSATDVAINHIEDKLTFTGATIGYVFEDGPVGIDRLAAKPAAINGSIQLWGGQMSGGVLQLGMIDGINDFERAVVGVWDFGILHSAQLRDSGFSNNLSIRQATGWWFQGVAAPTSGDTFTVTDGSTSRVYGFDAGGDVVVALGADNTETMRNFVAAVNGDGSSLWGARFISHLRNAADGAVVMYRLDQSSNSFDDRIFASLSTGTIQYFNLENDVDYRAFGVSGSTSIPSSDPGVKTFGPGRRFNETTGGLVFFSFLEGRMFYADYTRAEGAWEEIDPMVRRFVRVATDSNIADLSAGAPDTTDMIALAAGDLVLVRSQTATAENGVYFVESVGTGSDGTWERVSWFNATSEDGLSAGLEIYVQEGAVREKTTYTLTTTGAVTIDTTGLTFEAL